MTVLEKCSLLVDRLRRNSEHWQNKRGGGGGLPSLMLAQGPENCSTEWLANLYCFKTFSTIFPKCLERPSTLSKLIFYILIKP